ncbi:MAG: hypothetical protein ACOZNI_11020 [Myxococcota bacterium]
MIPLVLLACSGGGKAPAPVTDDTAGDSGTPGDDSGTVPDDDPTEGPEEDCSGVGTDAPAWELLDPAGELVSWDVAYGYPGAINGFAGVAYGDGRFLATVSNLNEDVFRWATSRDGYTWTLHETSLPDGMQSLSLEEVYFQRGRFVTSGYSTGGKSWFMTSESGGAWTFAEVAPLNGLEGLASSDDLTVYVGGNNDMRVSDDLGTWTSVSAGTGSFGYIDVDWGDGVFVANMNGGTANAMRSTDGTTWTDIADLPGSWRTAFGDGLWVAKSLWDDTLWTSTDGESFAQVETTGWIGLGPMTYVGGRFWGHQYVGSTIQARASVDGASWAAFGDVPAFSSPEGGTVTQYVTGQACGTCTCVFVGQIQDFTMGEEWLVDIYPLIAVGKVASN